MGGLVRSRQEIEEIQAKALESPPRDYPTTREVAARLYGQGFRRRQIAIILEEYLLTPEGRAKRPDWRRKMALRVLAKWEQQQSFRDMVWNSSVVKLDMATPGIMTGLAASARKGRVDAAKLALELTGRYTPKGDLPPTQIALVVNGIPRPERLEIEPGQRLEAGIQNE